MEKNQVLNGVSLHQTGCLLTDTGVPPEDVPVENVEGEVSEATGDLAVEILPIERTGGERRHKVNSLPYLSCYHKHKCCQYLLFQCFGREKNKFKQNAILFIWPKILFLRENKGYYILQLLAT